LRLSKSCLARTHKGETLEEARANLEEAVTMVLEANRELSEQSLEGAEVIRETLILPAA
jgi:predicted RNase H-like HicB family nuclease